MAKIDENNPFFSLTQVAEILNAKVRTIRTYEEKGLLPKSKKTEKKLYSLNDIPKIELVHYLASIQKMNASGIKYFLKLFDDFFVQQQREKIFKEAETKLEKIINIEESIVDGF